MDVFNGKVTSKLGCYVYALIDPRDNSVFYIGKGTGNRVFQHELELIGKPNGHGSKEKQSIIKDIINSGNSVKKVILGYGFTDKEAYIAENIAINLFNFCKSDNIKLGEFSNAMLGHRSEAQKYGKITSGTVDQISQLLAPEEIDFKNLKDRNVLVVSIDPAKRNFEHFIGGKDALINGQSELLNEFNSDKIKLRSLGNWSISKNNSKKYKYLIAVSHTDHLIVGAFELLSSPIITNYTTPSGQHRVRAAWIDPKDPNIKEAENSLFKPIHRIKGKNGEIIELSSKIVDDHEVRDIKKLVDKDENGNDKLSFSQSGRLID